MHRPCTGCSGPVATAAVQFKGNQHVQFFKHLLGEYERRLVEQQTRLMAQLEWSEVVPAFTYTIFTDDKPPVYESAGLHVLTSIFLINEHKYMGNLQAADINHTNLEIRQTEVMNCLRANLINPYISTITIFYNKTELQEYLERLDLKHREKIILVPTVRVILQHANSHLRTRF